MRQLRETDAVFIRPIQVTDADAAAGLCSELGYPVDLRAMKERIERLISSSDHVVYVACTELRVIGWIDVAINNHLATGAFGEIGGLIVSREHRSTGIGRRLVNEAERWVAARGIARMVVRSRMTREAAHRFYLREGYSLIKTSAVFSKELATNPHGHQAG